VTSRQKMLDPIPSVRPPAVAASSSKPSAARGSRLSELDALRGLAALSVFLGHAFGMMPQTPKLLLAIGNTPLRFFYDGNAAVLLFFVLSGFVLNLRYAEAKSCAPGWAGSFILRRVCRIYPAFLASMGLAVLLRTCVFSPERTHSFSAWFAAIWAEPLSWGQFARCLTLVGPNIQAATINPPVWSLVFEMRISLFFPLVILLVNPKRSARLDGLLVLALYILCMLLAPFAASFGYLPQFVLGAMCAKYFSRIQPRLAALSGPSKVVWLLVALALYGTAVTIEPLHLQYWRVSFLVGQVVSFGATGVILVSASSGRISRLLKTGVFQFLGRTSYSFYLSHFLFLITVAPVLYLASGSYLIAWLGTLVVTYLVSDLLFKFVEVPGMRLGSWASAIFSRRWDTGRKGTKLSPSAPA
jgi:peptidoglycan/LPS O-acetylase OafA/YrhL